MPRQTVFSWINFGAFAMVSSAQDLLLGAKLFPSEAEEYNNVLVSQLDVSLGANPQSMSYITGLGEVYPHRPLHWGKALGIDEPVPGTGVFGPAAHMPKTNAFYAAMQSDDNNYPSRQSVDSPFPIYHR